MKKEILMKIWLAKAGPNYEKKQSCMSNVTNIYQIKESLLCRSALTEVNEGNRSQYIRGHTRQSKN